MDKKIEISMLCQIYGKLLTEKQFEYINDYYNNDLSLAELAENYGITRQAVRDIIKKGENKLFEYEEKLQIMKTTLNTEKKIAKILAQIATIQTGYTDEKIAESINGLATETYVQEQIENADLDSYYKKTETYSQTEIDEKLANVNVDLTGYATELYVNNKVDPLSSSIRTNTGIAQNTLLPK